jgi:tRNA1Val (adenine37-N6)-methyltransferase
MDYNAITLTVENTTDVKPFYFKQFAIHQDRCTMKVGTDGVLLGAWADTSRVKSALDIGTGSGVIAIMLGQRAPEATIHAVEIDEEACAQAQENMQNAPWADRLTAFHTPIQDFAKEHAQTYDLIVSNPPFFSGGTFSNNQNRMSVRHTIKLPHGDLLAAVRTLLADEGRFCVILPFIEGLRFQELAKSYHLYCTKITEVKPKADKPVERLLMQFERDARLLEQNDLTIQYESRNEWTEAYMALTGAFYLYM